MINIDRKTGEVTGSINADRAWERIVEAYVKNSEEEEKTK